MELVITVKDGATNTDIARTLRHQANLIDGMDPKQAASTQACSTPEMPALSGTKPAATNNTSKKAAAAAPVDEDDDFKSDDRGVEPEGFDEDDEPVAAASFEDASEEEEAKPAAAKKSAKAKANGKAKKITLDDVNDACKAHAQAKGRPATLAVLQNKFKTQSVTALKPEQYEACISAMSVN